MSKTKALLATLEIVRRLQESPDKPDGHLVEHYRLSPTAPDPGRTLVYPGLNRQGETKRRERLDHGEAVEETLTWRVETIIDPGSEPPDVALDPFEVWTAQALLPEGDWQLGGLVSDFKYTAKAILTDKRGRPVGQQVMEFEGTVEVGEFDLTGASY